MAFCAYCGKEMGLWAELNSRRFHGECGQQAEIKARTEALRAAREKELERAAYEKNRQEWVDSISRFVETGEFPTVNAGGGFLPEPDEICHFSIAGVKRATFLPQRFGSSLPQVTSEGTLHITNRRLVFLASGGTVNLALSKLLQASCSGDIATFAASNRTSAVHFSLDPEIATALVAAVQVLAEKAKREQPTRKTRKNKSVE